jgi:hypothetical protein
MRDQAEATLEMGLWQASYTTIRDLKPYLVNSKGRPDSDDGKILLELPAGMTPEEVQISVDALHRKSSPCPILALPYFWIPTEQQKGTILFNGSPGDSFQSVAEATLRWCLENHKVVIPEDDFSRIVSSV